MRYGAICIGLAGPLTQWNSFLHTDASTKTFSQRRARDLVLCPSCRRRFRWTNWMAIYVICLGNTVVVRQAPYLYRCKTALTHL